MVSFAKRSQYRLNRVYSLALRSVRKINRPPSSVYKYCRNDWKRFMLCIWQRSQVSELATDERCALCAALCGPISINAFGFNANRWRSTSFVAELYVSRPVGLGIELSVTSQQFGEA